jgi:hypothetical protein
MNRATAMLAILACGLAGCATRARPPVSIVVEEGAPEPTGWRALATPIDQQRLALVPWLWPRALGSVPARLRAKVRAEGPLLGDGTALELPAPPPGPYRCRLVRLGGRAGFRTYPPDFCYVEGDSAKLSFTKQTGSNLPGGWLYVDSPTRLVFLGALPKAGEKAVPLYGLHPDQDVVGVVERVSPFRWRMVLAKAGRGSVLDVYELVPVPPAVPGETPALPTKS